MVNPQVLTYFEASGPLGKNPVCELFIEISQAGLSGSLRLENGQHKAIVYFNDGELVYAVSNARQHRVFDLLLRSGQVKKEQITACKDFTNDHMLAAWLMENGIFDKQTMDHILGLQIREIALFVLNWMEGEWNFNALARVKEDVWKKTDLSKILSDFSKNISAKRLAAKFYNKQEVFSVAVKNPSGTDITSQEFFILSRLDQPSSVHDISLLTGFGENDVAEIVYNLWVRGFVRRGKEAAFSPEKIQNILSAAIQVKEMPKKPVVKPVAVDAEEVKVAAEIGEEVKADAELTVEQYLGQVEKAETYYDILGVELSSDISLIKTNYFHFAKRFHPDKYHTEAGSKMHQRIQHAFTQIAQAYETLKDKEARDVYNFKMRREVEKLKKREEMIAEMKAQGTADADLTSEAELQKIERAQEEFDHGFDCLMKQELAAAIPFLARAVNLAPKQARYRAYYGKALSHVSKNRHQAEQEFIAATKIEPGNTSYRLMLIEFYIDVGMPKRAEGELKKLLAKEPNNEEAQMLLEGLQA
jgi:curved DNA-binding protein CbpA